MSKLMGKGGGDVIQACRRQRSDNAIMNMHR